MNDQPQPTLWCPPHLVPPKFKNWVVSPTETPHFVICVNRCGAAFYMRPPKPEGSPVLTNSNPFSREAAASIEGEPARTTRQQVYDYIRENGPIACWQVEAALTRLHQSVSPAIHYLKGHRFIVVQGTNKTPTGRRAAMYVVPKATEQATAWSDL